MTIESWSTRGKGAVSGAGRVVSVVSAEASGRSSRAPSQGESSASACGSASCIASPRPMATGDTRQAPSNRMPARRQAKHNKGDTGPKQRSHDSKKRDVRRLSGKGKPPEVSGRSQGGAEQHVASDHGHCRLFEKHPRPQQDSNACGEGRQKRQHGCCEGAAGPRKERHPEGAPPRFATARHPAKPKRSPASHDSVSGI